MRPASTRPDHLQLAGASGGALVAGSTACGVTPARQLETFKRMAMQCRSNGFLGRVRRVLHENLDQAFPQDAHLIANNR